MKTLELYDWFELHTQDMSMGTPPPAAMETVVGLFNKYFLEHSHIPHIFSIPFLMTHMWRNQLSKESYVFFAVNVGRLFGPALCINLSLF